MKLRFLFDNGWWSSHVYVYGQWHMVERFMQRVGSRRLTRLMKALARRSQV